MNAHDLARLLLEGPDLPVITARELDLEEINGIVPSADSMNEKWWNVEDFNFRTGPAVLLW